MSNHLPDWNDLPSECREAMVKAAGWYTEDWEAGQCALDMYNELKKALPAQTFPLFRSIISGAEIALARDNDVDAALRILASSNAKDTP